MDTRHRFTTLFKVFMFSKRRHRASYYDANTG